MKIDQKPSIDAAKSLNNGFIGIEIGTWEGDFSYALLNNTSISKLYCIDPYRHFQNNEYPDGMNSLTQIQFDEKFNIVQKRFEQFGKRVEFLRMTSDEAITLFDDNSIDFIYIDGNHDYKYVLNDIRKWYPKVKIGGILAGDDIYSTKDDEHDSDGNVTKIWSYNPDGTPSCWGKYGTYKALVDAKKIYDFEYIIDQTQFIIHK